MWRHSGKITRILSSPKQPAAKKCCLHLGAQRSDIGFQFGTQRCEISLGGELRDGFGHRFRHIARLLRREAGRFQTAGQFQRIERDIRHLATLQLAGRSSRSFGGAARLSCAN